MTVSGRILITTDVENITSENVISVIQKALSKHQTNAAEIQELLDFEEGEQPQPREKKYRPEIDINVIDNIANEIVEFKLGYNFGYPITFKMRNSTDGMIDAIQEWNDQYFLSDADSNNIELARYLEIGGICCTYIDINTEWEEGEPYYIRTVLNPRTSFVIYSSYYYDKRPMLGVTYRKDSDGIIHYTAFSKTDRYEIKNWKIINDDTGEINEYWSHEERSGEKNPLNIIPIVEYFRSYDRMGCFERQIPELENINLLLSDFSNDVDQNTQVVWWANDCEFDTEEITDEEGNVTEVVRHPQSNDWLQTFTTRDGKIPKVQPLTVTYDYAGILNSIITQRALVLQKCNVPQRNDNSGGSTGIAMSDATGWSAAETAAAKEEMVIAKSIRREIKVICAAIRESRCPEDSPLRKINSALLEPSIKRQKSYELSVKTSAIATLLQQGFVLEDVLDAVTLFSDPAQVIERSGESVKDKQNAKDSSEEIKEDEDVKFGAEDPANQISNSPLIDGMSKEKVETISVEKKHVAQ